MDTRFKWWAATAAAVLLLNLGADQSGASAQAEKLESPGISGVRSGSATADIPMERLQKAFTAAGISSSETAVLTAVIDDADAKGLPLEPLIEKIEEGIVKGVSTPTIVAAVRRQMEALEYVKTLLPTVNSIAGAQESWIIIADSLGQGLSRDELRNFLAQAPESPVPMLAIAVENLSLLQQIGIEPDDTLAILKTGLGHKSLDPSYRYLAKFFVVAKNQDISVSKIVAETIRALESGENLRQLMQRLGFTGRDMRHRPGTE
jgi:hypothetical protein